MKIKTILLMLSIALISTKINAVQNESQESVTLDQKACQQEEADACSICSDSFDEENGFTVTLKCKHEFHINCIHPWVVKQNAKTCPNCRADIIIPTLKYNVQSEIFYRGREIVDSNKALLKQILDKLLEDKDEIRPRTTNNLFNNSNRLRQAFGVMALLLSR